MERAKHYNDEQLLAHLDGELPPGENDAVVTHLKVCWECRAKSAALERQIETLAASLAQQTFPGADSLLRAKGRLQQSFLDFEYGNPSLPAATPRSTAFPRQWISRQWISRQWMAAGAVALVCVVAVGAIVAMSRRSPQPAAQTAQQQHPRRAVEAVRRADAVRETSPVHQVMRAEVRALTGSKRVRKTLLDVWEEPEQKRFAARWLDDSGRLVDGVWRTGDAQIDSVEAQPVSQSGHSAVIALADLVRDGFEPERVETMFRRWVRGRQWRRIVFADDLVLMADRDGAAVLAERVDGVARFTASSQKGGQRITIILEIDEKEQTAISQRVRYEAAGKAVELLLITERRERVPRNLINPAVFRPPVHRASQPSVDVAPSLPAPEPEVAPAVATAPDLSSVVVQVEYLLHDLKACTGEPLTVRAEGPEVVVRGLVMDKHREHALSSSLAELHAPVRLELQAYEDAARKVRSPKLIAMPQTARAAHLPLEDLLAKHFSNDNARIAAFTSAVIAAADQAMSQAWALRRLEERYDRAGQDGLTAPSRRLVEAMKLDHKGAVSAAWREVHRLVTPVLATMQPAVQAASTPAHFGFDSTNRCNRLVHALFAGADPGAVPAEQAVAQLLSELAGINAVTGGQGSER